jgi:hypothetical protein
MKINIGVIVREEKKEYFDVEFPFYRKHDVSSDDGPSTVIYSRISVKKFPTPNRFKCESITLSSRGSWTVEIDEDYKFDRSGLDYLLGKGIYSCDAKEYWKALEEVKQVIGGIR